MSTVIAPHHEVSRAPVIPPSEDGGVRQEALSIVVRIRPGHEDALRAVLREIDTDIEANALVPFQKLTRIHFARWVVFDAATDARDKPVPATLVLSTNYDAPMSAHLWEMVEQAGPGLDRVYEHCEGYPSKGSADGAAVVQFLLAHRLRTNTFYVGTVGRSVGQIRREAQLRAWIGNFIDAKRSALVKQSPAAIRGEIQNHVRTSQGLEWAMQPPNPPPTGIPGGKPLLVIGGILLIPVAILALLPVGVFAVMLRLKEKQDEKDARKAKQPKPRHTRALADREDQVVQNQLSSVINIKPGLVRTITINLVLTAINLAARYIFNKGKLGSIPSIHFARWVITDDGRRLAFFSNFDGSWESYLGEFVDKASEGLTAVWSNCVGFPRTRWLLLDGARDEQRFKAYARDGQVVTDVWFSAYKTLTVLNITNNSEIRKGLTGNLTPTQVREWLQRL